ncbi:MAG TPA: DUF2807 domain-containing protein [Rhizomicrobium sp.]|nr:DUF2807 domain-containing protein [Rhizomicrobium sp.]
MRTANLLAATILLGSFAAACTPEPPAEARTDDTVVRTDTPMARTDVALTPKAGGDVPVGHFDSVELRGGGHVILRYGATERVTLISGSTQFTHFHIEDCGRLVINACTYDCPSHYDLEIQILAPHVNAVAIRGGGHIESVPGFPAQGAITAAIQGGGDIDLRTIDAANGTAAVDGGGKIRIHASRHLTAAVNGGGSIAYWGAAEVTSAINGGGSIHRENGG